MLRIFVRQCSGIIALCVCLPATAGAQAGQPAPHDHAQMQHDMPATWHLMQDGVVYADVQPSGRPARRRRVRRAELVDGHGDAHGAAVRADVHGDAEPRSGDGRQERLRGDLPGRRDARRPAARSIASTRTICSCSSRRSGACRCRRTTALTLAGGPVGEPALGPVAFMHRPSAAENPFAAARAPHLRLDAHRLRRRHRGGRSRPLDGRRVGLQRSRA